MVHIKYYRLSSFICALLAICHNGRVMANRWQTRCDGLVCLCVCVVVVLMLMVMIMMICGVMHVSYIPNDGEAIATVSSCRFLRDELVFIASPGPIDGAIFINKTPFRVGQMICRWFYIVFLVQLLKEARMCCFMAGTKNCSRNYIIFKANWIRCALLELNQTLEHHSIHIYVQPLYCIYSSKL